MNHRTTDVDGQRRLDDSLPVIEGAVAGIVAWILGYAITYVRVGTDIRESPMQRVIETFGGEPATYEMVGWVFYNTHNVNTVFQDVPVIGSFTTSYIGGEDGFTVFLYAVPIVLLVLSGFVLARYGRATDPTRGSFAGLTILPGYLIASVAGLFLFEVTIGGATGTPDFVAGLLLAGILYPIVCAGTGGAIGGLLGDR